jgi:hypothetical protein
MTACHPTFSWTANFKAGPFAWNGLLAFWVPGGLFSIWFYVVAYYQQQETEPA